MRGALVPRQFDGSCNRCRHSFPNTVSCFAKTYIKARWEMPWITVCNVCTSMACCTSCAACLNAKAAPMQTHRCPMSSACVTFEQRLEGTSVPMLWTKQQTEVDSH